MRRPVHSVALRLMLLRLLYRGEEKRRAERIPIGCPVAVLRRLQVTQGGELHLRGWVARCERRTHGNRELPFVAALAFGLLSGTLDQRLRAVLASAARGPLTSDDALGSVTPEAIRPSLAALRAPEAPRSQLRRSLRRPFSSRVLAIQQRDRAEGLALRFRDGNPVLADQIEAVIEAAMRRTDAEGHGDVACVITEIAAIRTRAGVGCPEAQRFEGRVRP